LRGIARLFFGSLVFALAVLLSCCQEQINSPKPSISELVPSDIAAGQPAFKMEVDGDNFTPASIVLWNGQARTTLFDTTRELTAEIFAGDVQNAGTATVAVETQPPGGGTTTTLTFTIDSVSSNVPQITSISPTAVSTGGAGFALDVSGKNFVSQSTVTVNGNIRSTNFQGSTLVQAAVLSTDVSSAGTLEIAVVNPPPGGGSSATFPLFIKNPVPVITTLAPTAILAGSPASTLGVSGSSFVPDSVITLNGAPRSTSFTSSAAIQASLNAADFSTAGVVQVQVVNPADGGTGGGTSNILTFAVNATELNGPPLIVDLAPDGSQANTGICGATCTGGTPTLTTAGPSSSLTGQFVVFASTSTNLVVSPVITSSGIFLRDTCFSGTVVAGGASTCAPTTTLVSVAQNGAVANGASSEPSVDSGGAHVAYTSTASNLVNYVVVPGIARQVYWQVPCTTTATACSTGSATIALVSISADSSSPGNGESYNPVISSDGRYVAFVSLATNLLTNPPAGGFDGVTPQVFVRDTCSVVPPLALGACAPTTYLVSSSPDGTATGNGPSSHPAIASDGLFVSFVSSASNLVTGSNPNDASEVFERATCVTTIGVDGNTCAPVTSLVSTPDGVTPANGVSSEPTISQEGRFVAFASTAQNLIPGVGPIQQVYLRDTCTGVVVTTPPTCTATTLIASTPDGTTPANGFSETPSISECDTLTSTTCSIGEAIAFASQASNLNGTIENGIENIFVRNPCLNLPLILTTTTTGCVTYTLLASTAAGTSPPPADGKSVAPAISGDGNTVSFISFAANLVSNDSNALDDIFLANAALTFNLTVTVQGTSGAGSGTVTDSTGQISCVETAGLNGAPALQSGTCTARYLSGSSVTLTATPSTTPITSTFVSWAGSVLGTNCLATGTLVGTTTVTGTCSFPAIQNNTAIATFK
jgi:hypothetical protein